MNSTCTTRIGSDSRWLVCALLSAKVKDPDVVLKVMEAAVAGLGGTVVGKLLQRRGASRSNRPGGTRRMGLPLTQRTVFGSGKSVELAGLAESTKASHLLVFNSLTLGQRRNLAELTGAEVHSFLDESQLFCS